MTEERCERRKKAVPRQFSWAYDEELYDCHLKQMGRYCETSFFRLEERFLPVPSGTGFFVAVSIAAKKRKTPHDQEGGHYGNI